ncbi:MAG: hypothetical protein V3U39_00850, partial [Acidimicrobiia bacterium]
MNANPALNRRLTNGGEQLEGFFGYVAIMLGAHQQIDARVLALFVEHLEEVRFPVADVDESRMGHFRSQLN